MASGLETLGTLTTLVSLFTLAMIVSLMLLASSKGGYILSGEYRALLRATPQMRWWKTALGVIGLLVLLLYQGWLSSAC